MWMSDLEGEVYLLTIVVENIVKNAKNIREN